MVDTQTIEIVGRQRLSGELLAAGLEVAMPLRDRGIDLIAYADLDRQVKRFTAKPIQMKSTRTLVRGLAQVQTRSTTASLHIRMAPG